MNNEFTYSNLDSGKLSSLFKSTGDVSVKLSTKRSKIAMRFLDLISKLVGRDGKDYSLVRSILFLTRYLFLLVRIISFHPKLFQLFIFYFTNQPNHFLYDNGDGTQTIKFLSGEEGTTH